MTQNNERELLVKIKYAICMAIYSDDGLDGLEGENLMKEIDKYLSPISQNEQQEVVAYTDGEGDFITKEMYDEYLKLGFYTECIVPLYTSPKQIPDGWKPIETVPKDGTQVIIKCSGGRVATAFYDGKPFVGEGWHVVVPCLGGFGSGTDTFIYFPEDMPTHWMPLPTPTNTEVGE